MVGKAGFLFEQLGEPTLTPAGLFWLESRPGEGGRTALMRQIGTEQPVEVGPKSVDFRTRVHEYGGGVYVVGHEHVWVAAGDEVGILRIELSSGRAETITDAGSAGRRIRFADLQLTPDRTSLLAVRETCDADGVRNELVSLRAFEHSEPVLVAGGRDFYAAPRVAPDGEEVAYLAWDHPQMPWDGTELIVAKLEADGSAAAERVVAGSTAEAVQQPVWGPEGTLHFISDRDGWWGIYRLGPADTPEPVVGGEYELGLPPWRLGLATYAFLADGTLCCVARTSGTGRLGIARPDGFEDLGLPFDEFMATRVTAVGGELAFVAASPDQGPAVIRLDVATRRATPVSTARIPDLPAASISRPRRIAYDSDGSRCFMNYYPPTNSAVAAPEGELPPLVVNVHGGPTAASMQCLDLAVQYWTSRGFAYADVDYGGSSGLGRAYRERLKGCWGLTDVLDTANAAAHLVSEGLASPGCCVVRGLSAGGYTTLRALARTDAFAAGASYFGIADMALMARTTHKFESHYVANLIGRVAEMEERYAERSPIFEVERISVPVALLQGEDDAIVPPDQAVLMAKTLADRGVPATLRVFPKEGHGFRDASTIATCLELELELFTEAIGID